MKYELRYYMMCGRDGSVSDKDTVRIIEAGDDKNAIENGNKFLKDSHSGTTLRPWYPVLFDGARPVAIGDPGYPPLAHHLSFICKTRELISA